LVVTRTTDLKNSAPPWKKSPRSAEINLPTCERNLPGVGGNTGKGAAWIRDKLTKLGIIAKTAD
jgi:hypothetical protein